MSKFFALNFSVSEDGFMAGASQSESATLGENGGSVGIDNDYIKREFANIGATIMGRNMF